jgi:Cupredoxin-like domain
MCIKNLIFIGLIAVSSGVASTGSNTATLELRFENHRFSPQTLTVAADTPLEIRVVNLSRERIEFESFKLNREKVVEPGGAVIVKLPALRPGSYDFFDDFHEDVPEGAIVAK